MERVRSSSKFGVRLRDWVSALETLVDGVVQEVNEHASTTIGHIPTKDRKSAWMTIREHPAASILIHVHQKGSITGDIVMDKLKTPMKVITVARSLGIDVSNFEYGQDEED